jgi:hypothetical protein
MLLLRSAECGLNKWLGNLTTNRNVTDRSAWRWELYGNLDRGSVKLRKGYR